MLLIFYREIFPKCRIFTLVEISFDEMTLFISTLEWIWPLTRDDQMGRMKSNGCLETFQFYSRYSCVVPNSDGRVKQTDELISSYPKLPSEFETEASSGNWREQRETPAEARS